MMPLIFIAFVVLVIVLIVAGQQQQKKRREALSAWAASRGWTYSEAKDRSFDERFEGFGSLRSGSNRYAYNIITGRLDKRDVLAFDYHYQTTSTDSKGHTTTHHHYFSAVIIHAAQPLKPLMIRPESVLDKISGFFGYDDIDFESAEFSRAFYVKSPDRRWAYDVLQPTTIEFLLQAPRYAIEFDPQRVIARNGRLFEPDGYESAISVVVGVLDRLPGYLKDSHGADS
ncbi:MAG: hypothetical protein GC164_12625 [Phycisphaera sp.]|nr:hypothetical protein [Phycisphaera sp.]